MPKSLFIQPFHDGGRICEQGDGMQATTLSRWEDTADMFVAEVATCKTDLQELVSRCHGFVPHNFRDIEG